MIYVNINSYCNVINLISNSNIELVYLLISSIIGTFTLLYVRKKIAKIQIDDCFTNFLQTYILKKKR